MRHCLSQNVTDGHHWQPGLKGLRLNHFESGSWNPGEIEREDASLVGKTARVEPAAVRFGAPSAERQTNADTASIRAALFERAKELVDVPSGQAAALVLDRDEHALGARHNPQRHVRPRPGELERILQKVPHDRGEDLPASLDGHTVCDRRDGQSDVPPPVR